MSATAKIDYKKELREIYRAPSTPVLVDVVELQYLMIDGAGDPTTAPSYRDAVRVLYGVSYVIKFAVKRARAGFDCTMMPLEGLWWSDDPGAFRSNDRDSWNWTMMIMQPEVVTEEMVAEGISKASTKEPLQAFEGLKLERLREGLSVQIMHIGPYSGEGPTIEILHAFAAAGGFALRDKHHEIYLTDPRRVAPERMKTMIRQPVEVRPS
jgi:hypothetical protein